MIGEGPILILEDDPDDQEILEIVFSQLDIANVRKYFRDAVSFIDFLRKTSEQPFLIISDINMAKQSGIELKRKIEKDPLLKSKTIPFVFLTTSASPDDVKKAYNLDTQGFFVKPNDLSSMISTINHILTYWRDSLHPNNVK